MKRGASGEWVVGPRIGGEAVRPFVPNPLPPRLSLAIDPDLREEMDAALLALGRLDCVSSLLPDTALFLYTFVRKEAVLSSQIEGTQSSLSDLLLFEIEQAPGVPVDDTREVSNYVRALEHGVQRLRSLGQRACLQCGTQVRPLAGHLHRVGEGTKVEARSRHQHRSATAVGDLEQATLCVRRELGHGEVVARLDQVEAVMRHLGLIGG